MNAVTTVSDNVVHLRRAQPEKRPYPWMRAASAEDVNWDPIALPNWVFPIDTVGGVEIELQRIRSGESFAVCRPGHERWPLGQVSDHYRVVSHRATAAAIKEFCSHAVTPRARLIVGHGYAIVHGYDVKHMAAASVARQPVAHRLMIVSDHSGSAKMQASIVLYVGDHAIGSIACVRGGHVASQPDRWQGEVDGMIEQSLLVQDAVIDLLRAAEAAELTDDDRKFFAARGMKPSETDRTALDACRSWIRGRTKKITWNVWQRRMTDESIRALVVFLGREVYGKALDAAMGYPKRIGNRIVEGDYQFAK